MRTLFFLAVATIAAFARDRSTRVTAPACGPADVNFDVQDDASRPIRAQPSAGKAFVYVIQDNGGGDCLASLWGCFTRVGFDGRSAGATHYDSWLAFNVDPGERHLCVSLQSHLKHVSQLVGLAHFDARAGKIYYFRTRAFGRAAGSQVFLDLDPIDSDQGRFLVGEFAPAISHPKN
jgi:hypothetical protein